MKTLAEAFHHTLKDVYYAENAILKAAPKVAKSVGHADLAAAIDAHVKETREQVKLLDQIFASIGETPAGEKCDAIEGLIKECDGIVAEAEGVALNAGVIGALQAIEHYEIARYGTLREWAKELGNKKASDLLGRILDMEKAANNSLTGLAVTTVNEAPSRRAAKPKPAGKGKAKAEGDAAPKAKAAAKPKAPAKPKAAPKDK